MSQIGRVFSKQGLALHVLRGNSAFKLAKSTEVAAVYGHISVEGVRLKPFVWQTVPAAAIVLSFQTNSEQFSQGLALALKQGGLQQLVCRTEFWEDESFLMARQPILGKQAEGEQVDQLRWLGGKRGQTWIVGQWSRATPTILRRIINSVSKDTIYVLNLTGGLQHIPGTAGVAQVSKSALERTAATDEETRVLLPNFSPPGSWDFLVGLALRLRTLAEQEDKGLVVRVGLQSAEGRGLFSELGQRLDCEQCKAAVQDGRVIHAPGLRQKGAVKSEQTSLRRDQVLLESITGRNSPKSITYKELLDSTIQIEVPLEALSFYHCGLEQARFEPVDLADVGLLFEHSLAFYCRLTPLGFQHRSTVWVGEVGLTTLLVRGAMGSEGCLVGSAGLQFSIQFFGTDQWRPGVGLTRKLKGLGAQSHCRNLNAH